MIIIIKWFFSAFDQLILLCNVKMSFEKRSCLAGEYGSQLLAHSVYVADRAGFIALIYHFVLPV